ncbi:MAG: major capsid protein [Gallionella sp.]|jgi:hypothetical protein
MEQFYFSGHTYNIKNYDRVATDLYVDAPLTNVSIAYKNTEYIAEMALPKVQVKQETGLIWKYGFERMRLMNLRRGDLSKSKASSYSVDTDTTYRIYNYALKDYVTQGMRDMAVNPMQPETDSVEMLTDILALNKEYLVASSLFNTGSGYFSGYTEALSASADRYRWNDYTNSNPLNDASYAKAKIRTNSGATADIHLIVGNDVWTQLENHPDVLDRIKYTQTGVITEDIVAKAMQISSVMVGKAMYNSANEGQTDSLSSIWGKYALFYHKGTPSLKTSATALIIHGGNYVRKWTDNERRGATAIEVEEALEAKIISARSGYLFSTAVS